MPALIVLKLICKFYDWIRYLCCKNSAIWSNTIFLIYHENVISKFWFCCFYVKSKMNKTVRVNHLSCMWPTPPCCRKYCRFNNFQSTGLTTLADHRMVICGAEFKVNHPVTSLRSNLQWYAAAALTAASAKSRNS